MINNDFLNILFVIICDLLGYYLSLLDGLQIIELLQTLFEPMHLKDIRWIIIQL